MFHFGECGRRRLGKFDPGFAGEPVDFSRSRENGHDDNRPPAPLAGRNLRKARGARRMGDATQLRDDANCVLLTLARLCREL
jgi:hypothetical protein